MNKLIVALSCVAVFLILAVVYVFVLRPDDTSVTADKYNAAVSKIENLQNDVLSLDSALEAEHSANASGMQLAEEQSKELADKLAEIDRLSSEAEELRTEMSDVQSRATTAEKAVSGLQAELDARDKAKKTAYTMLISTFTTNFSSYETARNTNIQLAAQSVNGTILLPGEEFSFMAVIGECTAAKGYQESHIFLDGETTTGIGGGVCQVSTTLFNAALLANMQITERHPHSMRVGYIPAGRDAAYYYDYTDLKFKNTFSCPIRINSQVTNSNVTFSIYAAIGACEIPEVELQVTSLGNKTYQLTRTIKGTQNYIVSSQYK